MGREGLRAGRQQQPGGLLRADRPEWSGGWGGFYPKMPPNVEAMTTPRTTQQTMIMIFFCRGGREARRSGLRRGRRLRAGAGLGGAGHTSRGAPKRGWGSGGQNQHQHWGGDSLEGTQGGSDSGELKASG